MNQPIFILTILSLTIVLSEWLSRHTFLRHFGASLLVILITAIWANINLIPSASDSSPLYDGIFTYIAPLSIFYLLLGVNLAQIKKAGLPMLLMFGIGALGTTLGTLIAVKVTGAADVFGENHKPLAGMLTGTYTGGSVNFNAIALHYEMTKEGNLYAGTVAIDNILTAVWMMLSLFIPNLLQRWLPRKSSANDLKDSSNALPEYEREELDIM